MTDGLYIDPGADKVVTKKRVRRVKYMFTGGGIRTVNGKAIKNGETAMLLPKQVTREWERVSGR